MKDPNDAFQIFLTNKTSFIAKKTRAFKNAKHKIFNTSNFSLRVRGNRVRRGARTKLSRTDSGYD
jgi:hypothetical protein